ncbi:hypothetical protein FQZ97_195360 [compost metagenome]
MLLVSWVDALRAITRIEINIKFQAREFFENRHTVFFCGSRVYRGLINNNIPSFQMLPYSFGSLDKRSKIRPFIFINRRWNGNYINVTPRQIYRISTINQVTCLTKLFSFNLQS